MKTWNWTWIAIIAFCILCWTFVGLRCAHSADLVVKSGDVLYAESKAPTQSVKVDSRLITASSKVFFSARKGGFVFVNILTETPLTTMVFVDSLAISKGDTTLVPIEKEIQAFSVAGDDTTLLWKNRNLQCSWVEYKVDKSGNKVVLLIDVDGSELTLPVERVLRVWK